METLLDQAYQNIFASLLVLAIVALGFWAGRARVPALGSRWGWLLRIALYAALGVSAMLAATIGVLLTYGVSMGSGKSAPLFWLLPLAGALGGIVLGFCWEADRKQDDDEDD